MDDVISRKKMSEFGNLSLVEDREDPRGKSTIKLPGTRKGDMSSRAVKPQVMVTGLEFSPTGREFAAATTEGLLMYSLDSKMIFDPFDLEEEITPKITKNLVKSQDYDKALSMALRLNETDLIREVLEQIPPHQIELLSSRLSEKLILHLLKFIGAEIESSKHIGFYAKWSYSIMMNHGLWIRRRWKDLLPILNQMQKALSTKVKDLSEVCDRNEQTVNFLLTMANVRKDRKAKIDKNEAMDDDDVEQSDEEVEEMDQETLENELGGLQAKWSDDDD